MSGGGIANPAPLGLFAFGITTLLLSFDNAGISSAKMLNLVLAHALFYGGAAQFATGMWEFASGSVFGATVFSTFGAFWITFAVFIWAHEGGLYKMATDVDLTIFFLVWATFVAMLTVITSRISKVHCFLFGSVAVVLYLLAIGEWVPSMHKLGGFIGLVSGVTALYLGYATLINEVWKGEYLPIGVIKPKGAAEAEAKLELEA